MSKKKSEFLSGFGTAFEILKKIVEAVYEQGGNDDDLRRLLSDKNLAEKVAKVILGDAGRGFAALPTTMTVGSRTYDILGFLHGDEKSVAGQTMVDRAKVMNANLGADDGQYLLDHQDEIPVAFCGKAMFFFTDWRHPGDSRGVACVYWGDDCWVQDWFWLGGDIWVGTARVLRRK